MNVFVDINKAKQQAKHLATYLASVRRRITHSQALEAVAHMYGAREWNVLAAKLPQGAKQTPPEEAGERVFWAKCDDGLATIIAIKAVLSLDDGYNCNFDVHEWFAKAREEEILEIAAAGWAGDYSVDELAHWARDSGDEAVIFVFQHQDSVNADREDGEEKVGFEVSVSKQSVWRFCRAFRYETFVKLVLIEEYVDLATARGNGIYVDVDPDQPQRWMWRIGTEGSDVSYETEAQAWRSLGRALEEVHDVSQWLGDDRSVMGVVPDSGFEEGGTPAQAEPADDGLVPGRFDNRVGAPSRVLVMPALGPHLTHKQLRDITNDCEHRVCIAVSVPMSTLIDGDIEVLNDFVSEAITGHSNDLSDLGFERYSPEGEADLHDLKHNVFILVNAQWDPMDGLEDDGTAA